MDIDFETRICKRFFNKRSYERLLYELTSKKKRGDFLCKMSHTSKLYIGNCILSEFIMPPKIDDIITFLNDKKCYIISAYDKYDGKICEITDVLSDIWANGMPYMVVNLHCDRAYLETEYNFSEHVSYFLKVN